ncbi:hypothetical protein ACWD6L_22705 [Micromonospora profundi]|uniref:Uncharacterized protein n=1 Tax=Micromonospora profundi TaxID=1420889 RepID=A0AAJ6KXM1_9ACTN|nr:MULTISPECIES: hypothetical protein [Micromonospora]NJC12028.1 hypothetical protein [Micromonospora profundi]WLS43904.1 hypothetical protein Q3V37_21170 [Micromonospora profundi]
MRSPTVTGGVARTTRAAPPTVVAWDYAARHRFLESVAVVVHTIGLPVFVTPRAPCLEQNDPGCTVATDGGFGFAVVGFGFGAAVVAFGLGAAVVVFGLGLVVVGFTIGRGVGSPLVSCGPGVGLDAAGSGIVDGGASGVALASSARRSLAVGAVCVAAAVGFLSLSSVVSAPMVPTPQHSKTEIAAAIPTAPRLPIFFFAG